MKAPTVEVLTRILKIQEALTADLNASPVIQVVTESAEELTGATAAVVEIADGEDMVYRATSGAAAAHRGVRLKIASSLSGLCVRMAQTLRCDDTEQDNRVDREACRRVGARSMLLV